MEMHVHLFLIACMQINEMVLRFVRHGDEGRVSCRRMVVDMQEDFGKIGEDYRRLEGLPPGNFRLLFDGERLGAGHTPVTLKLDCEPEDLRCIDVAMEQHGG